MNLNSFALRRGALITLILVLATALAACSGNSDESQPADGDGGNGTATVADGAVEITAEGLAFDATTIEAAGRRGLHDHAREQRLRAAQHQHLHRGGRRACW